MDLFDDLREENRLKATPARRADARTLDEYVGQSHFLGQGKLLRRMLLADRLNSLIFYGPPGSGKTAARARHREPHQEPLRALQRGPRRASRRCATCSPKPPRAPPKNSSRAILFIDEIHRFNRAQQDVLLPDVEDGVVILIGATTQNPFFAINTPLLSRDQIFRFARSRATTSAR